jgi:hypothetical protein
VPQGDYGGRVRCVRWPSELDEGVESSLGGIDSGEHHPSSAMKVRSYCWVSSFHCLIPALLRFARQMTCLAPCHRSTKRSWRSDQSRVGRSHRGAERCGLGGDSAGGGARRLLLAGVAVANSLLMRWSGLGGSLVIVVVHEVSSGRGLARASTFDFTHP